MSHFAVAKNAKSGTNRTKITSERESESIVHHAASQPSIYNTHQLNTPRAPLMTREARNDLFQTTFTELHQEAPAELLKSLRERLEFIRANNPQSAQTAEACLQGLGSDNSTLLHVLTAAYLINGGVMLKHHAIDTGKEGGGEEDREEGERDFDFRDLEEELNRFSDTSAGSLKAHEPAAQSRKNLLSTD